MKSAGSRGRDGKAERESSTIMPQHAPLIQASLPRKNFRADETLFREGETAEAAYILVRGAVELAKSGRAVGHLSVAEIVSEPGRVFGLLPLVDKGPRLVTARALRDTMCLVVSRTHFDARLAETSPFIRDIVHILSYRLRQITEHLTTSVTRARILDEVAPSVDDSRAMPLTGVQPEWFAPGTILYREGHAADHAYLLERGAVELTKAAGESRLVCEIVQRPGMFFGILPLIDGGPHVATARVLEDTSCLVVDRSSFARRYDDTDPLVREVVRVLASRLREMTTRLSQGGVY